MPDLDSADDENFPEMELALREGKAVQSSSFLLSRIVEKLQSVHTMDSNQLQDLLINMPKYGSSLEMFESTNHSLRERVTEAELLSNDFQEKLNLADDVLKKEKITSTSFTAHEAKKLSIQRIFGNP